MTLTRAARQYLFVAAFCLLLLALGAAMLVVAQARQAAARAIHLSAQQEREAAREQYQRALHDEPAIRRAVARFQALQKEGLVGPERRLDWSEALNRVRETYRLEAFAYELAPQRSPLADTPALKMSRMNLQGRFLHEAEFLGALAALRVQRGTRVLPRQCVLERANSGDTPNGAGIRASCELDWITLSASSQSATP